MRRDLLLLGGVLGLLSILIGAFGAHAVRDQISPERLAVYQTGVQYHQMHALALLLVALLQDRMPGGSRRLLTGAGWLFVAGIFVFSGSLYALALTGLRIWGAVTPLGGLCFIAGWALLSLSVFKGAR